MLWKKTSFVLALYKLQVTADIFKNIYICLCIFKSIYIYTFMCMCVCVSVCVYTYIFIYTHMFRCLETLGK